MQYLTGRGRKRGEWGWQLLWLMPFNMHFVLYLICSQKSQKAKSNCSCFCLHLPCCLPVDLMVPLLPRGIPRRRHRRRRRRWADEELMASALACANHFPVGISLWGIVTWEFRVLACACYLATLLPCYLCSLGRPIGRKLLGNCPAAGTVSQSVSQSVLQLSLMKHNICAANRSGNKRFALSCTGNPSSCSSRTPLISTAGRKEVAAANCQLPQA